MHTNEIFIKNAQEIIDKHEGDYYLFCLDINNFQSVNYIYGLDQGDSLLILVIDFLKSLRNVVLAQRIFSDSFLFLTQIEGKQDFYKIICYYNDKLNIFLKELKNKYYSCEISFACGCNKIVDREILNAIDCANFARKEAKYEGKQEILVYNQKIQEQIVKRQVFEREILDDIEKENFCFYLQPKIDLLTGKIIGAEALARRIDENGVIAHSNKFLIFLEETGAIIKLDFLIFRQVCKFMAQRINAGLPVIQTSVNLSRVHTRNPDTALKLHTIAKKYHIPQELIEFELTETILLKEFVSSKRLIDQLREYGYRVSIDDFGSGYAGINIWQELDFDLLKLDKKFLSLDPLLFERNKVIVPNVINIAQQLHIQVLCEGVETKEQCEYLLQLGCTIVQGYYFSKPVDRQSFYDIYESQKGYYDVSFLQNKQTIFREDSSINLKKNVKVRVDYSKCIGVLTIFCVAVLCCSIIGIILYNNNLTQKQFIKMVEEDMSSYTEHQKVNTLNQIEDIKNTLQALSVLISQNNDQDFINTYLLALNEENKDVVFMYSSIEKLDLDNNNAHDYKAFEKLKKGESIVTDVSFSKYFGNIYCIGIKTPVMKNGQLIGAIRAIINAEELISTSLYTEKQGQIIASLLVKSDGMIVKVDNKINKIWKGNLFEFLKENNTKSEIYLQVKDILKKKDSIPEVIRLGTYQKIPYYLSIADLGYNDWHLVICLKADKPMQNSHMIIQKTTISTVAIILIILLAYIVILMIFRKMQRQLSIEEQRYLLLEQFSDIVLFDYDCFHDVLKCTSNATKLLRIHGLNQEGFVKNIDGKFIFSADQSNVKNMFLGKFPHDEGEIRIRLIRPDEDSYFWALLKYKYIYQRGRLVSVIGRITNIDSIKQHEEFLIEQAQIDGLTGLYNKKTIEQKIKEKLRSCKTGMLFMIDIDNFKLINDNLGHAKGDLVLQITANSLCQIFDENDILGRVGGDELIVFCNHDQFDVDEMITKIMKYFHINDIEIAVSIGIAKFPDDGHTYEELFQAADQAMYYAKKYQGTQLCFYSDI